MQAWMLLALALLAFLPVQQSITLEVRTFDGPADVSDATRIIVHRAGERDQPVAQINSGARPTVDGCAGHLRRAGHPRADRPGRQHPLGRAAGRDAVSGRERPSPRGHQLSDRLRRAGSPRARRARGPTRTWRCSRPRDHGKPAAAAAHDRRPTRSSWSGPASTTSRSSATRAAPGMHGIDVPLDRTRLWIVP